MVATQTDNPFLQANFGPWSEEGCYADLRVISGKIPVELNGVLYRNGPNPQFPENDKHWFQGDGMIHAISLHGGKADYQNRWVRTDRFKLERQVGRPLFGNFMNPNNCDPLAKEISGNTANTHIISHGGRLLALQETTYPTEINPHNLHTLGEYNYAGQVPAMSAHPHFDRATGEMLSYNYTPFSNAVSFYVFDKNGRVTTTQTIQVPFSSLLHDFAITTNHVIFPILPLTFNMERAYQGKPVLMWEPEQGSHFGIMPRNGAAEDLIWFELEPFYVYHFMNAYEDKGCIILDGMRAPKSGLFPDDSGVIIPSTESESRLTRWVFNLRQRSVSEFQLDDTVAEFPRFDERFTGVAYRHGFAVGSIEEQSRRLDIPCALVHYDLQAETTTIRRLGAGNTPSEPVFVPKHMSSKEGEGYLLSVIYDAAKDSSVLLVLDALHIDQDPIAIVELPHRIPNGFHGSWVDAMSG